MTRKLITLALALMLLLSSCAMAVEYPICGENDKVTLTVYVTNQISGIVEDYNATPFWQKVEEITGVHIEWQHPVASNLAQQMNLLFLGSEKLPDIILCGNLYTGGDLQGVEDGEFVNLAEYLPEYAPDYWNLITASDEVWRDVANAEGVVPAFYIVKMPGDPQSRRILLQQEVLDKIGFEGIPDTVADLEDMFAKMLANGITPYVLENDGYEVQLMGMYDVREGFYMGLDGQIKYGQVQPEFKEYLTLINKWYEAGYISKDFIGSTKKINQAAFDTGEIGMYFDSVGATFNRGAKNGVTVVSAPYCRLEENQQLHWESYAAVGNKIQKGNNYNAVITTDCENIEAAVQWMNFFYTEEGANLCNWGVEGQSFTVDANNEKQWTDLMVKPEGMTTTEAAYYYKMHMWPKLREPDVTSHNELAANPGARAIRMRYGDDPYVDDSLVLSDLIYTSEQTQIKTDIMTDLETYVNEQVLLFITSERSLDTFDDFVKDVWSMGLQDVLDVVNEAYEAYNSVTAPKN